MEAVNSTAKPIDISNLGSQGVKTHQGILAAAELTFSQYGLQGTRVRDIADAAGVNVATLYNYYKNKQALYEAVLDSGLQPLVEIVISYNLARFDKAMLHDIVTDSLMHLQQHSGICKLIYLESINNGQYLENLSQRWFSPLTTEVKSYFGDGVDESERQQLIALFFHLSFGHFCLSPLLNKVFDTDMDSVDGVKEHAHFCFELLLKIFPKLDA
ncbi:MAG: TetR/AcrR family transcriptional regulator [Pseudomonadales bacterium]|nr:TetR/AcrR family transcriptional regulator [Pseudomonadales bacterium]